MLKARDRMDWRSRSRGPGACPQKSLIVLVFTRDLGVLMSKLGDDDKANEHVDSTRMELWHCRLEEMECISDAPKNIQKILYFTNATAVGAITADCEGLTSIGPHIYTKL